MATSKPGTQSAAERRSAEAEMRALVTRFAPEQVQLVDATRRALRERLPSAHEVVYEYRDCAVISLSPSEHGYEGVFAIRASAVGIQLYFNQSAGLPDPDKLLKGSGKQARAIDLEGPSTLTRPAVARLIDEAIARNPVPFAATGSGSVVIRSTTAKKKTAKKATGMKATAKKTSAEKTTTTKATAKKATAKKTSPSRRAT